LGFLWIGTEDGLNRYDGYSIVSYKHNPRDTNALIHNRISGICDYEGEDLLVTTDLGFTIYRRATNIFTKPSGRLGTYATMGSAKPVRDNRGRYWIILGGRRVLRYDPTKDSVTTLDPFSRKRSFPGDLIQDIMIDNEDSVWVTTERTVSVFLGDNKGFQTYPLEYDQPGVICKSIIKDHAGDLWIATNGGVYRFDREHATPTLVPLGFMMGGIRHPRDQIVGGLCWDRQERLWIGGFNGLYCFNPKTKTTTRYARELSNPMSLLSNRIYSLLLDSSNVLWVGTWRGGVSKTDLKNERFGHYVHSETTPLAGASNDIVAIHEQPHGIFWFASVDGGLTRIDFKNNGYEEVSNKPGNRFGFCDGEVSSLTGDTAGNMWVAVGNKVACYDPNKKTFSTVTIPANHEHEYTIQIVYVDRKGCLWLGIQALGIVKYEPRKNAFTYFTTAYTSTDSSAISGAWLFFEDRSGNFWAGGWGGNNMLFRYDSQANQFYEIPYQKLQSARTMVEDSSGNLWIGTWGGGMSRFNPQTREVHQYLEQDGLPSNFVKGIVMDSGYNLWISTERGLSKFSLGTNSFRNYSVNDGLQGDFYYTGSCLMGSDGRLYFGGSNGFNAFYPESIREEEYSPPVLLTNFRVFDTPRAFEQHLAMIRQITLPYREDVFAFDFVSLDFSSPDRNRYMYKLEGYDIDWIQAGSRRYASYTHLDPGSYTFKVKGTNSDGVWSSRIASVGLTITPAFWQTWWFRSMLIVIIGGLLYFFYRYRLQKFLELERMRTAIATDLHDDIGTSLTNIALFSDLAQRDVAAGSPNATHRLEKISQTSRSLLDSMNDIVWSIKPDNDALEQTILRMEDYAVQILEENGIDLHVQIPEESRTLKLPMTVRRNLFLIFKEAIGNVLKHSGATQVDIIISITGLRTRQRNLHLVITDNGKGFNPSSHKQGNGLENMERRVDSLGGSMKIFSEEGCGTTIETGIPLKSPI